MNDTLKTIKRMGVLEYLYPKSMWRLPVIGILESDGYVKFIGLPSRGELDEAEEMMKWQQEFFERLAAEHVHANVNTQEIMNTGGEA